jgi:hypothetical protein
VDVLEIDCSHSLEVDFVVSLSFGDDSVVCFFGGGFVAGIDCVCIDDVLSHFIPDFHERFIEKFES